MAEKQFTPFAEFYSPTKIVFGLGASSRTGQEVRAMGGTKALVVTDKVLSGLDLFRPVLDSLDEAEIPYVIFDEVLPDAPARLMLKALEIFKSQGCDIFIGFGGGSSMDTAKGASLMATNGTDLAPMLGAHRVAKKGVPKIAIPTTNVAGADVGSAIVLTLNEETHEHGFIVSRFSMPDLVINDPLLTLGMPPHVTADTGIDVLATAIESFTSARANPFSDLYSEKIIQTTATYLPVVCSKGSNLDARYHMALSASMCGLAYMSSGLGLVHGLGYCVAAAGGLSHGRSLAPILPAVMRYNIPGSPQRFSRVAELMGKNTEGLSNLEGARLAVEAVEELMDTIGMPHHLRDFGITEKNIPAMVAEAYEAAKDRFSRPNPRDFDAKSLESILLDAL